MAIGNVKNSNSIQRLISESTSAMTRMQEQLASGKRINRASDDAAGLAIAASLLTEESVQRQAVRNADDGVSQLRIAEGAAASLNTITDRQAELAAQSANGTLSDEQRSALNDEYQQLEQEKQRIIETTEFNGQKLFQEGGETVLQVGSSGGADSRISISSAGASELTAGGNILSAEAARSALDEARGLVQKTADFLGRLGATESRVDYARENVSNAITNNVAARSRIEDADIATSAANYTANQIRQQAGVAMMAQANLSSSSVLQLLR